jgi:hypothetical protein
VVQRADERRAVVGQRDRRRLLPGKARLLVADQATRMRECLRQSI